MHAYQQPQQQQGGGGGGPRYRYNGAGGGPQGGVFQFLYRLRVENGSTVVHPLVYDILFIVFWEIPWLVGRYCGLLTAQA